MTVEVLVDNLPMCLNLGDLGSLETLIGYAKVTRNSETGLSQIEISLDKETSDKLGNMVDVFELKAIGFAGIKKRPVSEI